MKIHKIIGISLLILSFAFVHAQEIKLDTYKFGEGLNFSGEGDYKIKLSGYIQPYMETQHQTGLDELSSFNRFRMRRLRLRIDGNSGNQRFNYRFQVDISGSSEADATTSNYLLDAYVSYDITKRISVTFGQRSTYTDNRELFMDSKSLQLVERSPLTSAFSTIREFGLFLDGNFKTGKNSYLRPYFVLTNGDGGNVFKADHGGVKIGGRLDYLPFGLFTNFGQFRQVDVVRELSPKLVIGANFSQNNGMSSRRGRESGTILYLNDINEESLPDYSKYGVDFLFKYQGFSALGEYIKSKATVPTDITQRVRADGTTSTVFDVNGVQDVENYVKGRMMLGEAYNFQMGYIFKSGISIDGRYTHLKSDKTSFLTNATFYNRPNYYTLGISKFLGRNYGAKIQADYTFIDGKLGINDNNGNPLPGNETLMRIMLTVSF